MPRTNHMKKYKHITTGQECDAAQYIAEMVLLREAEKANEGTPAFKLWNTAKWKNKFRSQVTKAYQLLKKYDEIAIINALKSPKGNWMYSLRLKALENIIKYEQVKVDKEKERKIVPKKYVIKEAAPPRKPFGRKSTIQKLRDLDG